jgi:hypothetical protein
MDEPWLRNINNRSVSSNPSNAIVPYQYQDNREVQIIPLNQQTSYTTENISERRTETITTTLGGPEGSNESPAPRRKSDSDVQPISGPAMMVRDIPNPEPADIDDQIKQMKDFTGSQFEDDLLKVALRAASWDMNRALNNLFEPENVSRYRKEAEQAKQQQQTHNDGSGRTP